MKIFKQSRLVIAVFSVMLLGASITSDLLAQVNEKESSLFGNLSSGDDGNAVSETGVISLDYGMEGDSVVVVEAVIDENLVTLEVIDYIVGIIKGKVNKGDVEFTPNEMALLELLDEGNTSYKMVYKGNISGKVLEKRLSIKEMIVASRLYPVNETDMIESVKIEDMVKFMDKAISMEDESFGCRLMDNKVVFVMNVTMSEYKEIKDLVDIDHDLVSTFFNGIMQKTIDEDSRMVFEFIKSKGYSLAYYIVCDKNEPIVIDLDF